MSGLAASPPFQSRPRAKTAIKELEAERSRIARELHDSAGQSLAGILLNLELIEQRLGPCSPEVHARLARSRELAALTLDQIRRISHELLPPAWSEMDFREAVEWLLDTMGVRDKAAIELGDLRLPAEFPRLAKTVFYRVLQEGLTNILRHADATRIRIQVEPSRGGAVLVLEDNGTGFDPAGESVRRGIGLANIRKRVESLAGRLEIHSALGRGVRLAVFLPAR